MSRAFQDQQIRQYLLGDIPASEESEFEAAYFHDSELLARMELVRDDLADDYAAARLSAADREKFERRLLASNEGREEFAITRALRDAAVRPALERHTIWRLDRRWLSLAAAVPLALATLVAWRLVSGPERTDERPGPAQGQIGSQGQAANPTSPPEPAVASPQPQTPVTLATLILTEDLERSRGVPPTLLTSTGATDVELVVPRTSLKPGTARARVDSVEGAAVWSGSIDVPAPDAPDPRPRARIPVSSLAPGDYFFSIPVATDATGGPRYYFRVRTR
jgi:hypothetical protein